MIDLGLYSDDVFLTVQDICDWLGMSRAALYKHRSAGTAPLVFHRMGGRNGATARAVRAWVAGRETPPAR